MTITTIITKVKEYCCMIIMSAFILACSEKLPNDKIVHEFFEQNKEELVEIIRTIKNNPSIERVDTSEYKHDKSYRPLSNTEKKVKEEIRIFIRNLGIKQVYISRLRKTEALSLVSVGFTLKAAGLSIGGESKGIKYITNHAKGISNQIQSGNLKPLSMSKWYIYHYIN